MSGICKPKVNCKASTRGKDSSPGREQWHIYYLFIYMNVVQRSTMNTNGETEN